MNARNASATSWVLAGLVFLSANIVVPLAWDNPEFRWSLHNVSDLGNVSCRLWDTDRPRMVCSPWHDAMNAAFIATGLLIALGAVLFWTARGGQRLARTSAALILCAGLGYVAVGVYPADVNLEAHVIAAFVIFGLGNAGLWTLAVGARSGIHLWYRATLCLLGATGLVATPLFLAKVDTFLGIGGMERVVLFPMFIGLALSVVPMAVERRRDASRGTQTASTPESESDGRRLS